MNMMVQVVAYYWVVEILNRVEGFFSGFDVGSVVG